jgi:hypothetical protein
MDQAGDLIGLGVVVVLIGLVVACEIATRHRTARLAEELKDPDGISEVIHSEWADELERLKNPDVFECQLTGGRRSLGVLVTFDDSMIAVVRAGPVLGDRVYLHSREDRPIELRRVNRSAGRLARIRMARTEVICGSLMLQALWSRGWQWEEGDAVNVDLDDVS